MGIFTFFFGKNKLKNDNGLNETYFKKSKIIKEKFYKKDGKRHGKYKSYLMMELQYILVLITMMDYYMASVKNGL